MTNTNQDQHILFIFLDGIGLGDDNPETNPFAAGDYPTLHSLSNGKRWVRSTGVQETERAIFIPTDACLGVEGRPQSGTGQATIVTGRNIPEIIGRHYGPKPDEATRKLLDEDNIFMQVSNVGKSAGLLDAHPPQWHNGINSGKRLPASYQYAARTAGISFGTEEKLRAGEALSGNWTGEGWRTHLGYTDTPLYTPHNAGVRLVELSRQYDFGFFPHWWTDTIGHRGTLDEGVELLSLFNGVMNGVLDTWQDNEGIIIITSDHGNMEEIDHRKHTRNAVPTVIIGERKSEFAIIQSLVDFVPSIIKFIQA